MGYFDDVQLPGQSNKTSVNNKKTGGYFDDVQLPSKEPSIPFSTKAKDVGLGIIKSIVKPGARMATNLTQAAQIATGNKPTEPFSGKFLGEVKPVGVTGKGFKADLADAIGVGLELSAFLPVARTAKVGYETAKGTTKFVAKELAKEGAVGGFLGATGSEIQRNVQEGTGVDAKTIALGTGVGTVLNPIIGVGSREIAKLFGVRAPKKLDVQSTSGVTNIPISTPETRYREYRASQGYEPYIPEDQLPVIEGGAPLISKEPSVSYGSTPEVFIKRPEALPEPYIPEDQLPVIEYGKGTPTVKEPTIQYGKTQPDVQTGASQIEDITYEPIRNIENTATQIINKGKNAPEVFESIKKELPVATTPPEVATPINVSSKADEIIASEKIPEFQSQTNKGQIEAILQKDQNEIFEVALGRRTPTDNIPANAYYSVAKNLADDMAAKGNSEMAFELANSPVASRAGQELQASNITSSDNIVDIMTDIKRRQGEKLSYTETKIKNKKIDKSIQEVQKEYQKLKGLPNVREAIDAAISKIICK